jgi:hypothetical protein
MLARFSRITALLIVAGAGVGCGGSGTEPNVLTTLE